MDDYEAESGGNSKIFYDGFTFLSPLARLLGASVDQVNFLVCILIGFAVANVTRTSVMSRQQRAVLTGGLGFAFCYFCYGKAIIHLFLNMLISYALMYLSNPKYVHIIVFGFSMSYLLLIHTYRFFYQKSYCLDVTSSFMIAVGKVTLLASALHDGIGRKGEEAKITKSQKADSIKSVPSPIDFISYMIGYQTILSGPMYSYSSWSDYLDGTHIKENPKTGQKPDPSEVAKWKFQLAFGFFAAQAVLNVVLPISSFFTEEHNARPLPIWFLYFLLLSPLYRISYYGAWMAADGICNASGYGFRGFDEKTGEARWDLITNVKPYIIEFSTSYKELVDNWNISTVAWFRRVVYERVPEKHRKIAVYTTSAVWHGVHVGYYFAFGTGYLCTLASSTGRKCLRHHFVGEKNLKMFYDVMTFIAARIASSISLYSFIAMNFEPSLAGYKKIYFIPHLVLLFIIYLLPLITPPQRNDVTSQRSVSRRTSSQISSRKMA